MCIRDRNWWSDAFCAVAFILPIFGLMIGLLGGQHKKERWALPIICCYIAFLAPYIVVSYYERYGVAVSLARMLFTFWFLVWLSDNIAKVKARLISPKT